MQSRKLRKSKRGQINYLIHNAFRLSFMIAALLAFFVIINYYINNQIDSQELQAETLANRILYSDAVMLSDGDIGRTYPGIIDMKKFTSESLDSNINYGDFRRHAAAKLKLLSKNPDPSKNLVADCYLNNAMYENWKILITSGAGGAGGAMMYVKQFPVTYLESGTYKFGTLIVEVIIPNS